MQYIHVLGINKYFPDKARLLVVLEGSNMETVSMTTITMLVPKIKDSNRFLFSETFVLLGFAIEIDEHASGFYFLGDINVQ